MKHSQGSKCNVKLPQLMLLRNICLFKLFGVLNKLFRKKYFKNKKSKPRRCHTEDSFSVSKESNCVNAFLFTSSPRSLN